MEPALSLSKEERKRNAAYGFFTKPSSVHQMCEISGPKAVVDIHHGDAGRA
jgi:hypothetical protein